MKGLLKGNAVNDDFKFICRKRVNIWVKEDHFHMWGTLAYQYANYEPNWILSCAGGFFDRFYRHLKLTLNVQYSYFLFVTLGFYPQAQNSKQ